MASINLSTTSSTQGTGIDVNSVVDQILYAERAPERLWQQQQAQLSTQATALSSLNTSLQALSDKANALRDFFGALAAKSAQSSDPTVLAAQATPSAVSAVHSIRVTNLAATSSYYTDPVPDGSTLSNGSFSLKVGAGNTVSIVVDDSRNTLETLAAYLNSQNLGIRASVIRDASGSRLALVSQTAGAPGDLTVSDDTSGLGFHKSVTGVNASFTVDGVPISSTTNNGIQVLDGVTFNLLAGSEDRSTTLTVTPDVPRAEGALKDFVSAYNTLISGINNQFRYNPATKSAGPLAANSSLRTLQSALLSNVSHSLTGNNGFTTLSSLGVTMNNDGTLSIDDAKMTDAITKHADEFKNFFQDPTQGFAVNFSTALRGLADSTEGILSLNLAENATNQRMLTDLINDFEDRLAARQKQLLLQYSQVDTMLRQFPLLMAQITGQLGTK
jgi:flagellar hook-associated protein 2